MDGGRNPWSFLIGLRWIRIGGWSTLNQSGQSRFRDGEAVGELLVNLIDGCNHIIVVDLLPWIAEEQAVSHW